MKKLLTLILCWLLAFSAMAETTFKAKTAASVAGGYVTSLNKVDGSFEDGSTQWSASVGTIVPTASTEFQGNNIGVWAGTGTGTLDLQWTATASNTYEASAQVDVKGEGDVYVCAYVGTAETGCKRIPALSKIQKVSVIADSVISSAFYLRLKHTGSDAFSIKVDNGKIEPWTPQVVNFVEKQTARHYGTGLLATTGVIRLPTTQINLTTGGLFSYDSSNGRITALKDIRISAASTFVLTESGATYSARINGIPFATSSAPSAAGGYQAHLSFSEVDLPAGRYVYFHTSATLSDDSAQFLTITASANSENVVQSWQNGMETWSNTSSIKIGATTTAPTKGTTDLDQVRFYRNGANGEFWYQYNQTASGSGTVGSGDYLFTLPNALQFSSEVVKYTTVEGSSSTWLAKNGIAAGTAFWGNSNKALFVLPYDATRFRVAYIEAGASTQTNVGVLSSSDDLFTVESSSFSIKFSAPVLGWSSTPTLYILSNRAEVFSSNVSASGVVSNATNNFVTSCTNEAPSVCSLWSSFGTVPICWAHATDITKRAEVSSSTATTTTVSRTDTGTAFNLFCHLK